MAYAFQSSSSTQWIGALRPSPSFPFTTMTSGAPAPRPPAGGAAPPAPPPAAPPAALAGAPADVATEARAPLVMVVNVKDGEGRSAPIHWVEELDWKAYAIVWRLHVVDHLHQAKTVLAAR